MNLPELYKTKDFTKEDLLKSTYGDNPTKELLTQFDTYWNSDKRWEDQDKFEREEHNKLIKSLDDRHAYKLQNFEPQLKTLSEKTFDKFKNWKPNFKFNLEVNTEDPLVKPETKIETGTGIATSTGVGTATEVPATNESSQDWHNHMASLGYKKKVLKDGTHLYEDPNTGINYFNNGRAYNPTTKNIWGYQWLNLRNETASNITTTPSNSNYWRNPYLSGPRARNFSINGKKYAVKVNTVDNTSYAYDPATNKYMQLKEDSFGIPTEVVKGATWVSEGEIPSIALSNREAAWRTANPAPRKKGPLGGANTPEWNAWFKRYLAAQLAGWKKNGGIINKHQQGGKMNENIQQQIVQLVQAAMLGNKEATLQINQIMAAAKQGDQKATQLAQMIQAVAQQMQGGSVKAALGAKLNYVQKLKGNCPEGTEKIYLKNGGCMCQQKKQSGGALPNKNNAPDKLKKKLKPQTPLKPVKPVDPINKIACGGKTKKKK